MGAIAFGESATIPSLWGMGSIILAILLLVSILFVLKQKIEVLQHKI